MTSLNVGLQRQNDGLSEGQVARNVQQAVLQKLGSPSEDGASTELSEEVYFLDGSREWTLSSQTTQHVDNRTLVETSLRQPLGALREVSYQLFKGDEILASAFEQRDDKLCAARQLAELLRLPLEEVFSDFDTICDRGWQEREEIRKFCVWRGAPMLFVNCQQLLDSYQPAVKEARAVAFTAWEGHAFFYKNARSVFQCDDAERLRPRFRSERRESAVPEFRSWREWDGELRAGHFWTRDLRAARGALLAAGHCPKVAMRSLCEWRSLRLRAGEADCVICELPEDAEALQAWMERFGLKYRGQRLAGATNEVFLHLLRAQREVPQQREQILASQGGACKLCGAPIALGTCEFDHVVPVSTAFRGQIQEFQALCHECHRLKTSLENSHAGEPLQPRGVRDLCELAAAAAAGLRAAEVERGPGLLGRGCGALPQEWARQRALSLASVLSFGFGAGGAGGPPGRPDLRQASEGRPRGAACQAAVCGRRLVRQAGVRPHAGGRRRDVAGLLVELGCHRPRGPELPCLGAAQDGGGLARGAPGQAERQCVDRAVGAQRGPGLPDNQLDGHGCQYRQTFVDAAGQTHWDHIFATQLFSNASHRPAWDFVMAAEYCAVARIRQMLAEVPMRYLKFLKTDCLGLQDLSKKYWPAVERLTRLRHADGTPVYRCQQVEHLRGHHFEPEIQAWPPQRRGWEQVEDPVAHCLQGRSPGRRTSRGASWSSCGRPATWCSWSRKPTARRRTWGWERRPPTTGCAARCATAAASSTGWWSRTAGGAGQLRRGARGTAAEGQRLAAGPRGRLLPRAHREPPLGRAHLPVHQLASGWGSRGGAVGRGGEGGAPRVPAAGGPAPRRVPGAFPRPPGSDQRAGEQAPCARGRCDDRAPGAGRAHDQRPADDASLARAAAGGRRRQGGQGHLRACGRGGRGARRAGRAAVLPRRAAAAHAALPRHHLRELPGADAPRPRVAAGCGHAALQPAAPLRRRQPGHQLRAAERALGTVIYSNPGTPGTLACGHGEACQKTLAHAGTRPPKTSGTVGALAYGRGEVNQFRHAVRGGVHSREEVCQNSGPLVTCQNSGTVGALAHGRGAVCTLAHGGREVCQNSGTAGALAHGRGVVCQNSGTVGALAHGRGEVCQNSGTVGTLAHSRGVVCQNSGIVGTLAHGPGRCAEILAQLAHWHTAVGRGAEIPARPARWHPAAERCGKTLARLAHWRTAAARWHQNSGTPSALAHGRRVVCQNFWHSWHASTRPRGGVPRFWHNLHTGREVCQNSGTVGTRPRGSVLPGVPAFWHTSFVATCRRAGRAKILAHRPRGSVPDVPNGFAALGCWSGLPFFGKTEKPGKKRL